MSTRSCAPRVRRPGWWRDALLYQVYVASYADSNDDGYGDLAGVTARLDHIADLGVAGVWLSPFYRSPMVDHGYDVADPTAVDPRFGDLDAFDALVERAHELDLAVLCDVIPNHVSSAHPWFAAALADPGAPERSRFHFQPGRGDRPPNDWVSFFGGPAWTRAPDGMWYLHLFTPHQPDVNWDDPAVEALYDETLRFWLARGVDGFRVDVAFGLHKPPYDSPGHRSHRDDHVASATCDQDAVHDVYRRWRRITDEFDGERLLLGEVELFDPDRLLRYVADDEMHLVLDFTMVNHTPDPAELRRRIGGLVDAHTAAGTRGCWVLDNHDRVRSATRYGSERQARAASAFLFALPGAAFVYQGQELGLEHVVVDDVQDPAAGGDGATSRDGCRVPLPWSGTSSPYGFSVHAQPWLAMPDAWAGCTVADQLADPDSPLQWYRQAGAARARWGGQLDDAVRWDAHTPPGVVAFSRALADGSGRRLACVWNVGDDPQPWPLAPIHHVALSSHGGSAPPDAAVPGQTCWWAVVDPASGTGDRVSGSAPARDS